MEQEHLHTPPGERPSFLRGLRLPATTDEVLAHAEAHGASPEALAFIEALPAAVFTTEEGVRHAFSELGKAGAPRELQRATTFSHDGTSS